MVDFINVIMNLKMKDDSDGDDDDDSCGYGQKLTRLSEILKHVGRQRKMVKVIFWTLRTPDRSSQELSIEYEQCRNTREKDTLQPFCRKQLFSDLKGEYSKST